MRRFPLLLLAVVACDSPPATEPSSTSLFVPEQAAQPSRQSTTARAQPSIPAAPPPTSVALRRVDFLASPTFRDGALTVLTPQQLDEVDAIYLGRFDLHAFAEVGARASVWLSGDSVKGAEVQIRGGERVRALWWPGADASPPGWYDEKGYSLRSEILGRAVALSRVTSAFGVRLHPITGNKKQHRGVDYGAPEGTPVHSVGDGVITTASFSSSAGNHIKIAHPSGYESWYLHLHHFEPGIVVGASVRQGQAIGAVGTTGASTGPHLHYELHRSGFALDPHRRIALPTTVLGPLTQPTHRKAMEQLR